MLESEDKDKSEHHYRFVVYISSHSTLHSMKMTVSEETAAVRMAVEAVLWAAWIMSFESFQVPP
jgi:ABC-type sulfate transport system permease component